MSLLNCSDGSSETPMTMRSSNDNLYISSYLGSVSLDRY